MIQKYIYIYVYLKNVNDFKLNPLKIEEIFFCLCETYVLEILKSHFPNSLFKTSSSGLRLK